MISIYILKKEYTRLEFNLWTEGMLLPRKFRFLKVNGDERERTEARNVFGKY